MYMIGLFGSSLLRVQSRVYSFIVYSIMLMEALTDRVVCLLELATNESAPFDRL